MAARLRVPGALASGGLVRSASPSAAAETGHRAHWLGSLPHYLTPAAHKGPTEALALYGVSVSPEYPPMNRMKASWMLLPVAAPGGASTATHPM